MSSAYLCPFCSVRATFASQADLGARDGQHNLLQCQNCQNVVYATGISGSYVFVYPQVREEAAAEYPDDVRDNLGEALRSLLAGSYKACVMMTRSALQAATRDLGATGRSLYDEIDDLAERNVIPLSLKDWAHEIRDGGNLAAHPEPSKRVDRLDAEELLALAESIFEYVYVIPKRIETRRARLAEGTIMHILGETP